MPDKTYVLDTSVLLYSAGSIRSFDDNSVVIPYVVLEELDKFKGRDDEVGRNARQLARELNELRYQGKLNRGVPITATGGSLRVELNFQNPETPALDLRNNDDRILNVCLGLRRSSARVILVTKDINLAVRADVLGVEAQDFDSDKLVSSIADMYTGCTTVDVPGEFIDSLYSDDEVYPAELEIDVFPNQFLMLNDEASPGHAGLTRVDDFDKPLIRLRNSKGVWGIKPRNREQHYALDVLMDPSVNLVTLTGPAGCGKTLLALACGLSLVQDLGVYDRLVVSRPVQPLGKDIGYLPGDVMEKMQPWMGPIRDSIEFLTRGKDKNRNVYDEMLGLRLLEIEPLTYIRGRSIPNTLFILDEAQDMTRPEIKTIVSRMGENSKLIIVGDVMQISNPYLDSTNNGLSYVIEKFKPYRIAAHVTLNKGERSELASIASNIL